MQKINTHKYLGELSNQLLNECETRKVKLSGAWVSDFPPLPGVYIFRDKKKIIYVGESGNLRGRMKDMTDTRNHVLRRNIGNKMFTEVRGFSVGTVKQKFSDIIEDMLNRHIMKNLTVCCMTVDLGRKELEEKIQAEFRPEYNRKGRRKA